jgi:hypothetical protein
VGEEQQPQSIDKDDIQQIEQALGYPDHSHTFRSAHCPDEVEKEGIQWGPYGGWDSGLPRKPITVQKVEGKRVVVLLINDHEPGVLTHIEDHETNNQPQANDHIEKTMWRLLMRNRCVAEQSPRLESCGKAHVVIDSPAARVPG